MGALVRTHGDLGLVEPVAPPPVAGTKVVSSAACLQMVTETVAPAWDVAFDMLPLGDADAGEVAFTILTAAE